MNYLYCFSLMLVAGFLCSVGNVTAQGPAPPITQSPSSESTYLPDLPVPTEEQLRRGDELLEKILYMVANIPLTDPLAVLKNFGFDGVTIKSIPAYLYAYPAGENGENLKTFQLKKFGFNSVLYQPWIVNDFTNTTSFLSFVINRDFCLSIESVDGAFQKLNLKGQKINQITAHPVEIARPLHDIQRISFEPLKGPLDKKARINFVFDNQRCANIMGVGYIFKEK